MVNFRGGFRGSAFFFVSGRMEPELFFCLRGLSCFTNSADIFYPPGKRLLHHFEGGQGRRRSDALSLSSDFWASITSSMRKQQPVCKQSQSNTVMEGIWAARALLKPKIDQSRFEAGRLAFWRLPQKNRNPGPVLKGISDLTPSCSRYCDLASQKRGQMPLIR